MILVNLKDLCEDFTLRYIFFEEKRRSMSAKHELW